MRTRRREERRFFFDEKKCQKKKRKMCLVVKVVEKNETNYELFVRGGFHLEVPKKIWSHIRRFKRTHIHPIRLFASPNVALSRHQKKSLDLTRISRV